MNLSSRQLKPRLITLFSQNIIKAGLGYFLRGLQGVSVYRKMVRLLCRGVKIKEADAEDLKKVQRWINPGTDILLSHQPEVTDFVATKRRKAIGFVQLVRHSGWRPCIGHWLFSLNVSSIYRGMGIGEKLTQGVIEKSKREGAQELLLLVREDNHEAIELYRKLGFKKKIVTALEEELEKEKRLQGRRRFVMSKLLA